MNKKKIAIISSILGLSTLSISVPLLVTSCSKEENINPVEVPSTANITTFDEALEFTNEFFQKNYTFAMFKNDLSKAVEEMNKLLNSSSPEGIKQTFDIKATLDSDKKLNLSSSIIRTSIENQKQDSILSDWLNFQVVPILVKQTDGSLIAKIGFEANWMGAFHIDQKRYKTLSELKQNEPNWQNQTIAQFIRNIDGEKSEDWVIEDTLVNNSKPITPAIPDEWTGLDCQSIKLVFNNIENKN